MRLIILLAVVMAASRWTSQAVADDTLNIRSLRSIDVCGSEKSALIAIDLGEIYFSDSLMSFDITLSYDTTYLIPGTVLSNGTLSQQLSWMDGPFLNAAVPGELRVFGASILTPAKGTTPLVAMTVDAKKLVCGTTSPIGLAYPAEFNPEFKRAFNIWNGDSIRFVARQTVSPTTGFSFEIDGAVTGGKDSTVDVPFRITTGGRNNEALTARIDLDTSDRVNIDNATLGGKSMVISQNRLSAFLILEGTDTVFTGTVILRQVTSDSVAITATGTVEATDCACIVPAKQHAVQIITTTSTLTGVEEADIDDDPVMYLINGMISIQGGHEYPVELSVYDVFGRLITNERLEHKTSTCQLRDLPPGPVFIMMTAGGRTKRMMQRN